MKRIAFALLPVLWSEPAAAGTAEPAADGSAAEAATDGTANEGATDGAADGVTDGSSTDAVPDASTRIMPPEDEGCSCRVASAPAPPPSWPAWLLGLSLALRRRQRKP